MMRSLLQVFAWTVRLDGLLVLALLLAMAWGLGILLWIADVSRSW